MAGIPSNMNQPPGGLNMSAIEDNAMASSDAASDYEVLGNKEGVSMEEDTIMEEMDATMEGVLVSGPDANSPAKKAKNTSTSPKVQKKGKTKQKKIVSICFV